MAAPNSTRGARPALQRYQTLVAIVDSIARHRDLHLLFSELARRLGEVVSVDVTKLALHDAQRNLMCLNILENATATPVMYPVELQVEDTACGWAWQHQQPLIFQNTWLETRFPRLIKLLQERGIRSYCALPLTTAHRRLGAIGLGSRQEAAYIEADLEFLRRVADQVAVAVDNALNSRSLESYRNQLARKQAEDALRQSQQQLQDILDYSPAAIYLKDAEGRYLRVNRRFEELTGISRQDALGKTDYDFFPPDLVRSWRAHDQTVLQTGTAMEFEEVGIEAEPHTYFSVKFPLRDSAGAPYAMAGISSDITARKRAEEALRLSQAMFQGLFESSPDGIVATGQDGRIVRVNAQMEKIFGYGRQELVGQPINALVPERYREIHSVHQQGYYAEPRTRPMGAGLELYGRRKDGSEFPLDIMLSPLQTDGEPLVVAVVRDITARKRAEDALRQSEERFRSIVESVKDYAICTLDPEGHVTSWNPAAERIKGYSAPEIISQHFSRFYLQEDIDRDKPHHALEMAEAQERFEDEGWRVRKDGSRFWANVIITALRDQKGQLRGFSEVTRDFTERKQGEEALLLEVTNALVANLDIHSLLAAISASIRQVIHHDYANLALYDPAIHSLRLHALVSPKEAEPLAEGLPVPIAGTPSGEVFTSREPLVLNNLEAQTDRYSSEFMQRWIGLGLKSGCWLPLHHRGRPLGVLVVGSLKESAFTEKDVLVLSHAANQVAIAIDNAETFRQVAELKERLSEEKAYLEEELRTEYNFEEIVGESAALKRVLKQVETVAPTDATVLILGETGTGKELVARAIHSLSARRERTFVKLNCAAIPSGLLESELFGHEKGAFTGAISQKIGRLELAHQGTLFLDEVGDIPLELQPKLLRALQEKEFERLGSTRTIPVDVRLIAATNRDLAQMVKDREFRSDLYYRLKVFPVSVPPLRDRREDIPILVHYFVQKHARRMNKEIETIPPQAMQALERWRWPGNVRELENLIERAVILSSGSVLRVPLAELGPAGADEAAPLAVTTLESAEREHILRALRETGGLIAGPRGAATRLGLKRTTLNAKMRKLGITRKDL